MSARSQRVVMLSWRVFSRLVLALLVSCCAATATAQRSPESAAGASAPEHLTSHRRLMLSGAIGGYWSNDRSSGYGSYEDWAIYGYPSLLYFVRDRVGVGLGISGGTSKSRSVLFVYRDHDIGFGPVALFDLPLGKRLSIFFEPRAGYFEQWVDRSLTELGELAYASNFGLAQGALFQRPFAESFFGPDRRRFLRFALSIPLVFHVTGNVGLALGPDLWFDVMVGSERSTRMQVGASTTIYVSF